ncbi:glycosyltransferase family 2 protein [Candidatus Pacearchaeota archaeon]|nr:glycosyltransferase family 2 protein [Candidatus Pacearchaeota archaeon]
MKNKNKPRVIIIIGTCNQDNLLINCLNSLKKTNYNNYKILLVDDSGRDIGKKLKKYFRFDLIVTEGYIGQSKLWNRAIEKSLKEDFDYVFLLDDDTEILDGNWLSELVKVGESSPKIGILGPRVVFSNGGLQWAKKYAKEPLAIKEIGDVIGCCFLIKKSVIDKVGFFDEKFSPAYGEESDFCFRASKRGFKLMYVGKTKIMHYGGATTKKVFNEKLWFYKKRHAIRLEWLNFNLIKILRYSIIHVGSAIFDKNPLAKLNLLVKAYKENIENLKEIKAKRYERKKWTLKKGK